MAAKKKQIDSAQVVEHDVEDEIIDSAQDEGVEDTTANTLATKGDDDGYTVPLEVTLSNGSTLTLHVIKDQNDWSYEAVEAMAEFNYPVLVNAILTRSSKFMLKGAGARVRDFEMITEKVSAAIGAIKDENDAEKKR